MNKLMIQAKQINNVTKARFSEVDVCIYQDGDMVILYKDEILELAKLIQNEKIDQAYYKRRDLIHAKV